MNYRNEWLSAALFNTYDGETMDVIEMEVMSWDYNLDKGIICLNYDSSDY